MNMTEFSTMELLKTIEIFKGGSAADDHIVRTARAEFERCIQFEASEVPSRVMPNWAHIRDDI